MSETSLYEPPIYNPVSNVKVRRAMSTVAVLLLSYSLVFHVLFQWSCHFQTVASCCSCNRHDSSCTSKCSSHGELFLRLFPRSRGTTGLRGRVDGSVFHLFAYLGNLGLCVDHFEIQRKRSGMRFWTGLCHNPARRRRIR